METGKLKGFINRYYLNGCGLEQVLIDFNKDDTKVHFTGTNKTLIGYVTLNDGIDAGRVGIYQTPLFVKYLGAFDASDELNVETVKRGDIIQSIEMKSEDVNVIVTAADPEIIPVPMNLKGEREYEFVVSLTPELMDSFKRYKTASDAKIIAIDLKPSKVDVIFNWSENNSNRIKYPIKNTLITKTSDVPTLICFSADIFSEIFAANKNATGTMSFNSGGLCKIELNDADYTCIYYIVKTVV
tara:strand:+ start:21 stop:746 length:726 start_codon:yes stop_codon:yes gene_type:complete